MLNLECLKATFRMRGGSVCDAKVLRQDVDGAEVHRQAPSYPDLTAQNGTLLDICATAANGDEMWLNASVRARGPCLLEADEVHVLLGKVPVEESDSATGALQGLGVELHDGESGTLFTAGLPGHLKGCCTPWPSGGL